MPPVYQKFKHYYNVLTHDLISDLCNSSYENLVNNCKIIFVCVPTPMEDDSTQNISILMSVLEDIKISNINSLIAIKSTVLPNHIQDIEGIFPNFVYNPEFLREKTAKEDFIKSETLILGGKDSEIEDVANLYKNHTECKIKHVYKTDIIAAANVICHVPDLENLIKGINFLLNQDGLFIFEEPYLGSMYEKTSYDQIYDEHIFMFSVNSIKKIFKIFNFDLINVLPQKTHGGSMRYVIGRSGVHKINNNVSRLLKQEKKKNIDSIKGCLDFKKKCEISKKRLKDKINNILKKGKNIAGYAATSKSTTILNYCGINSKHIDFICDTTPNKINTFAPGTHIPIVSIKHFKKNIPDNTFLFAWNHKKEIFKKEKKLLKKTKWFAHVKL